MPWTCTSGAGWEAVPRDSERHQKGMGLMARTDLFNAALAASAVLSPLVPLTTAHASNIPAYTQVGTFVLPSGPWDLLPDGRILQLRGNDVFRQDALNASTFSRVGGFAPGSFPNFGSGPSPSFLRVSPDGSRLAVGNNQFNVGNAVLVGNFADLSTSTNLPVSSLTAPNFDAAWDGNGRLYITGADTSTFASVLTRVDIDPPNGPSSTRVITGIGNGSGGVAVRNGTLYVGVGFLSGGSAGEVRAFDAAALGSAVGSVAFNTGTFAADALSGASLGFDRLGNLLIGGADSFGSPPDFGYAAVVDLADPANPLRLSPAGPLVDSYRIAFNTATDELLVAADGTAYRYAIPAPATAATLALGGLLAFRRRRHG